MSSLATIRAANTDLQRRCSSATAIFTGATHGIGLATLQSFITHIPNPTAIIAGRNRHAFEPEIAKLRQLNPNAKINFLEADLTLIHSIDFLADRLVSTLSDQSVDFLCMSQGYAPLSGREYTTEGLDKAIALFYHGRLRLLSNLLNSKILKSSATVLNILAGGKEGQIRFDDLGLERKGNYSIMNLRTQVTCMLTLSHDHLSTSHPELTLLHVYPGTVDTGLLARGITTPLLWAVLWVLERCLVLFKRAMSAEESGERMLELGFREREGGSWSLLETGEEGESEWLERYRGEGEKAQRVWEWNEGVWGKAVGAI